MVDSARVSRGNCAKSWMAWIAALLLWVLFDNARIMLAELTVMPARAVLSRHDDASWHQRDAVYDAAVLAVQRGLMLDEGNPDYLEMKGRLALDQCRYWVDRPQDKQRCLVEAKRNLQMAITANPQSASVWANLLLAKFRLGELDSDFFSVLDEVLRLGSSLFEINKTVATIGLSDWTSWNSATREIFLGALLRVHRLSPKEAKAIADKANRGGVYCIATKGDPRQHYSCRSKKRTGGKRPSSVK